MHHVEGPVETGLTLTKDHQSEPLPPTPAPVISPKAEGKVSLLRLEFILSTARCDCQRGEPGLRRDPRQDPRLRRCAVSAASRVRPGLVCRASSQSHRLVELEEPVAMAVSHWQKQDSKMMPDPQCPNVTLLLRTVSASPVQCGRQPTWLTRSSLAMTSHNSSGDLL